MSRNLFKIETLLVSTLFLWGVSYAQMVVLPPAHFETLDLTVGGAATVVTGAISSYRFANGIGDVMIAVKDSLKGKPGTQLTVKLADPEENLSKWKQGAHLLLIAVPPDPKAVGKAIDLSDSDLAVMTADLKLLHRPDEVLEAARQQIQRSDSTPKEARFGIPLTLSQIVGTPLAKLGKNHSAIFADVPTDARLEKWAHDQIDSATPKTRVLGIKALSFFDTSDNVDLLRKLLGDDGWEDSYFGAGERNKILHTRANYVRREAYKTLKSFLVNVDEPVSLLPTAHDEQVEYVELMARDLTFQGFDDLWRYPNFRSLRLAGGSVPGGDLWGLAAHKSLRELSLDNTNVNDEMLTAIARGDNLEYLGLCDTAVTDAGLMNLARMKSLKTVDVGSAITDNGIAALHVVRPDIVVRRSFVSFLARFHPRRIDQPLDALVQMISSAGDLTRDRNYALVIPAEYAHGLTEALADGLPESQGWKREYYGYSRSGLESVSTGYQADYLLGVLTQPGDVLLVVHQRIY